MQQRHNDEIFFEEDRKEYYVSQLQFIRNDISIGIQEVNTFERWTVVAVGAIITYLIGQESNDIIEKEYILFSMLIPVMGLIKYHAIISRNYNLGKEGELIEKKFGGIGIHMAFKRRTGIFFRKTHRYGVYILEAMAIIALYIALE